tara:strand:- start:371 stop:592 length:222 start_codon:yes stop_codon:yes gene_type:complete
MTFEKLLSLVKKSLSSRTIKPMGNGFRANYYLREVAGDICGEIGSEEYDLVFFMLCDYLGRSEEFKLMEVSDG